MSSIKTEWDYLNGWIKGATRGVTVSMSAFLACHPMLLRGFEFRLGLESSGCSMWHFLKLVARGFLRVLRFPPLLHRFNDSANKISSNKCDFNSVKLNS